MALPHNVERSAFRPGEYVAYDGRGFVWRVRRARSKYWVGAPAPNNPARELGRRVDAQSLCELAGALARIEPPRRVEPF